MKEDAFSVFFLLILWGGITFCIVRIILAIYGWLKYILYPSLNDIWIKTKPFWQMILRLILPQNAGTRRLCFFIGILLSAITMIKFRRYTGFGQIICGASLKSCYLFGPPTWGIAIMAFCIPFVTAKIIDFIIQGYNKPQEQK